jgi:hypothetical protein
MYTQKNDHTYNHTRAQTHTYALTHVHIHTQESEVLQQARDVLTRLGVKGSSIDSLVRPSKAVDTSVRLEDSLGDASTQSPPPEKGIQGKDLN